jgi:hypothetical protein
MLRGALSLLLCTTGAWAADEKPRLHPVPDLDKNVKTGPALGSKVPPFEAIDQNGKRRTFESLRGPKGLALLFVRSADW